MRIPAITGAPSKSGFSTRDLSHLAQGGHDSLSRRSGLDLNVCMMIAASHTATEPLERYSQTCVHKLVATVRGEVQGDEQRVVEALRRHLTAHGWSVASEVDFWDLVTERDG